MVMLVNNVRVLGLFLFVFFNLSCLVSELPEGAQLSCEEGEKCPATLICNDVVKRCLPEGEVAAELVSSEGLENSRALSRDEAFSVDFVFDKEMLFAEVRIADVVYDEKNDEVTIEGNTVKVNFVPREAIAEGAYTLSLDVIDSVGYPVSKTFDIIIDRQAPVATFEARFFDPATPNLTLGAARPGIEVTIEVNANEAIDERATLTLCLPNPARECDENATLTLDEGRHAIAQVTFEVGADALATLNGYDGEVLVSVSIQDIAGNVFSGPILDLSPQSLDSINYFSSAATLMIPESKMMRVAPNVTPLGGCNNGCTILLDENATLESIEGENPGPQILAADGREIIALRFDARFSQGPYFELRSFDLANANALSVATDQFADIRVTGIDAAGTETQPAFASQYVYVTRGESVLHTRLSESAVPSRDSLRLSQNEVQNEETFIVKRQPGVVPQQSGVMVNDPFRGLLVTVDSDFNVFEYDGDVYRQVVPEDQSAPVSDNAAFDAYYDSAERRVKVLRFTPLGLRVDSWDGRLWGETQVFSLASNDVEARNIESVAYNPLTNQLYVLDERSLWLREGNRFVEQQAMRQDRSTHALVYDPSRQKVVYLLLESTRMTLRELEGNAPATVYELARPRIPTRFRTLYDKGRDALVSTIRVSNGLGAADEQCLFEHQLAQLDRWSHHGRTSSDGAS